MAGVLMVMEAEVLARLIDRHAAALVLYARQWCVAAEDVVQEAIVRLAAQRTPPRDELAWLYRVVRNGAISAARAEARRRKHESLAAASRTWLVAQPEAPGEAEEVAQSLSELPLEQREIIVAHLWGGLTFAQAADVIGCSASAAHRRYQAGLVALRERMGVTCPIPHQGITPVSKPY